MMKLTFRKEVIYNGNSIILPDNAMNINIMQETLSSFNINNEPIMDIYYVITWLEQEMLNN